uniref:Uncharacterized protein n=1 Tax=Physcomitrium patens TaxID=3218 RepID=A0A2K1JZ38_PHYPA|nr:hypothetical protein PHYPA_013909 [Physcomitrium patens]
MRRFFSRIRKKAFAEEMLWRLRVHLGFKYWTITIVLVATVQLLRVAAMLYPEYKMSIMGFRSVLSRESGEGSVQTPPSMTSGTASSQPHRTKLTDREIEAILLGGAVP